MKKILATTSMALFILQLSMGCTAFCFCSHNRAIHLKFHGCPGLHEIRLKELLALEAHSSIGALVSDCDLGVPHSFRSITPEENREMILRAVTQLSQDMDLNSKKELLDSLISYSCQYISE